MYKQLQYIGEHIHAVTGVPYVVFQTGADLPEACIIPSCSICQNCPLETRIYAHTHSHGIQDAKSNGGKQIYDCRMEFAFCALVAKSEEDEEFALILGPIVSGELHTQFDPAAIRLEGIPVLIAHNWYLYRNAVSHSAIT